MNDRISIARKSFNRIVKSIEHYCVNSCPMFKGACLHFECPLFEIEYLLMDHDEEPLCWYLINFNCCDEIALFRTTNDKAERIADSYGEPYDLFVYGSYEEACNEMLQLINKQI